MKMEGPKYEEVSSGGRRAGALWGGASVEREARSKGEAQKG